MLLLINIEHLGRENRKPHVINVNFLCSLIRLSNRLYLEFPLLETCIVYFNSHRQMLGSGLRAGYFVSTQCFYKVKQGHPGVGPLLSLEDDQRSAGTGGSGEQRPDQQLRLSVESTQKHVEVIPTCQHTDPADSQLNTAAVPRQLR